MMAGAGIEHDRAAALRPCSNCGSVQVDLVQRISSAATLVVTSDAQQLSDVEAVRILCRECGCLSIQYIPEDRLKRYFREQYDLSDAVQNNLIVHNSQVTGKHGYIADQLFVNLADLPATGRYLEIACGKGELAQRFQACFPQWECYGIDPSSQSPGSGHTAPQTVHFIQDYFQTHYFQDQTFDLIVAHGFLNRSPVLPELLKIRTLCKPGTRLSFDLLVLEHSVFAPYIWDHSFMYTSEVLEYYLACAGFAIRAKNDCVSSHHYLCQCVGEPRPLKDCVIGPDEAKKTQLIFDQQVQWWQELKARYTKATAHREGRHYALFGAGLYNAVFLSLIHEYDFVFVIDETKHGTMFFGIPVISLEEASRVENTMVLVVCRDAYMEAFVKKLTRENIEYIILNPQSAHYEARSN